MEAAPFADDETGRLLAVERLGLVGTPPERRFDRIVQLAVRLTSTRVGVFSLVGEIRVHFKSRIGEEAAGLALGEPHRDFWFCSHVVATGVQVEIVNAEQDARVCRLAVVAAEPGLRAYLGAPVRGPDGHYVGVLGVFDTKPREFSPAEHRALSELARLVEAELSALPHATTDALTGVVNSRAFHRLGDRLLEFGDGEGEPSTVVTVDVVGMGAINRQHGFEEGDRALVETARLIGQTVRGSDLVGRIGPTEFGVVLVGADEEAAEIVLGRLSDALARLNGAEGRPFPLELRVSSAEHRKGGGADLSALLTAAALAAELG